MYDRGFSHYLVTTVSVLLVFSVLLTSFVKSYWEFILAQGVMVDVGGGLLFLPGLLDLSTRFHARLALAQGIAMSRGRLDTS